MLAPALKFQFGMTARVLDRNLAGVTDEDALVQPSGGGNCINWVVGHIVASREAVLARLGQERVWDPELVRRYERGSAPVASASDAAASLSEMREAYDLGQERILRALDEVRAEKLEEPDGESTVGQRLAFLQFHESYHAGQVAILRRFLGREGAIR